MDLSIGIKIKYIFPVPSSNTNQSFTGTIETIGESYLTVRDEKNTLLKISFKNYDYIVPIEQFDAQYSVWTAHSLL